MFVTGMIVRGQASYDSDKVGTLPKDTMVRVGVACDLGCNEEHPMPALRLMIVEPKKHKGASLSSPT
jgi:hypothetical protein